MRFYSLLIFLISFKTWANTEEKDLINKEYKIEKSKTLSKEQLAIAQSIADVTENKSYDLPEAFEIVSKAKKVTKPQKSLAKEVIDTQLHSTANNDFLDPDNHLMSAIDQGMEAKITTPDKNSVGRYGDVDLYIMISYSMPATSIVRLYTEAIHQHSNKNIVFLLRGWNAPDLQSLMAKVNKSIEDFDNPPNIAVDPTFFRKLELEEVPFFAIKNKEKHWKKVTGDISIHQAINEANNHYTNNMNRGRTYLIEEPDILSYIEEKVKNYDFEADIAKAKEQIISDRFADTLVESEEDLEYLVDPTTHFKKPMYYKDEVIVSPGQAINPLKFITLSKKYIVIDSTSKAQIEIAKQWQSEFNNVVVITNKMPDSQEDYLKLNEQFGTVQELDPLLTRRFALKHVPSLIEQQGELLKITVVGTKSNAKNSEVSP